LARGQRVDWTRRRRRPILAGVAGRDDGDPRVTEEIRVPGERVDPPDGAGPGRVGSSGMSRDDIRAQRVRDAARRERRQTLTFLGFFALILILGGVALAAYYEKISLPLDSGRPAPLPTCPSVAPSIQAPADTSVRVFNASNRNGLAMSVTRELQKRGFVVPSAPANDPQKTQMTAMAVIRHGPNGLLSARTVATVVAGEVQLVQDERTGSDVDLVLGATFQLAPGPSPTPSSSPGGPSPSPGGPAPSPTCVPAS
jgi:hypothetical protein